MLKHRIIPVLLYDGNFAVHTTRFCRPARRIGPIDQYVNNMANRDIDELILLDIEATNRGIGPRFDQIKKFTSNLYCPVAYGGGIRSMEDIRVLFRECGIDKIVIKTHYDLLTKAANKYGKQSVVYALDVQSTDVNYVYDEHWIKLVKIVERKNPGEVILTDIERNGTFKGYNIELIRGLSKDFNIPLIANGGCGGINDMVLALNAGASAVAASSVFTLRGLTPQEAASGLRDAGLPVRCPSASPPTDGRPAPS